MALRAPQRVPSHRASSANRHKRHAKALSHENFCTKHSRRQIKVLVLFDEVEEGQEVKWRDYHHQLGTSPAADHWGGESDNGNVRAFADRLLMKSIIDPRETPHEGQELWHLDPLRLAVRYAQHVQGVSGNVKDRGCGCSLPRHGSKT